MKRILYLICLALLSCTVMISVTGCSEKDVRPEYAVKFVDADGGIVSSSVIKRGETMDCPDVEEKPGYSVYWTDVDGNRVTFPKVVTGDETYYLATRPSLVENAYRTEYYLENESGEFIADESLVQTDALPIGMSVKLYPREIDGYEFDGDNPLNVTEGKVEPGKTVILKAYYRVKSFTFTFMSNGIIFAEKSVPKNASFTPDSVSAPEVEGKTFSHWSESENGVPFEFGVASRNVTLYAVYTDEARYSMNFPLYTDLYAVLDGNDDVWAENENFDQTSLPYGYVFEFDVYTDDNVVGVPSITVVTNEDGREIVTIPEKNEKGLYSLTVTGNVSVTVSGLAARQFDVRFTLAYADCDESWAIPVADDEKLYLVAQKKGATTVHEVEWVNRTASVTLTAGRYTARLCRYDGVEYLPVSAEVGFNLSGSVLSGDVYYYDGEVYIVHDLATEGAATVAENGDIFVSSGTFTAEFATAKKFGEDFAVTLTADQLFEEKSKIPHGDNAESAPKIGFCFRAENGRTATVTLFDTGSSEITCDEERSVQYHSLCQAGSILGKPEWADCYRHAKLTFIKYGSRAYLLFSGNGNAGGVTTAGKEYAPTSAVEYENYPVMYFDLENGTVYYNENKSDGKYYSAKIPQTTDVLSNVASFGFTFGTSSGKTYAKLSDYGYTVRSDEVKRIKSIVETSLSVNAPKEAEVTLNGQIYGGEEIVVDMFTSAIVSFVLPDGKIAESFTDCGKDAAFTVENNVLTYVVSAYTAGEKHDLKLTLKDGIYTAETSVFVTVGTSAEYVGPNYGFSMLDATFVNVLTGETVSAKGNSEGKIYTVLKRGKWTAYVSNGYSTAKPFTVVSGEGTVARYDALLCESVASKNSALNNGGLVYDSAKDALRINPANYAQQDSTVGGVTFVPEQETLEFGYTVTGMKVSDAASYYYPFLGMFVCDNAGGMMRYVNRDNGGNVGFMLAADYNSRSVISFNDDAKPFATATGDYSWSNDKPWMQTGNYELEVKIKLEGYLLSVWVRTSESKKAGQDWIGVFADAKAIDVYSWYDSDEPTSYGVRRDYLNTVYDKAKPCSFGITARIDKGHKNDVAFSGIWYKISKRK